MDPKNLYIGIDAGTQSVKTAIYDGALRCIATYSLPTTLHYPQPGWVQMDIDEFYRLTLACLKKCATDAAGKGYDLNNVRAIMADGIICGICGIDEEGKPVTPYINYLDSRTQADADAINAQGNSLWARETGNPEASCMFPALFARWFIKNSPEFNKKGVKFVHDAAYVLMHLAGLKAKDAFIDWGTMSGWGLGYKVEKKEWSREQLDLLGIDPKYMPRIVKPWDVVGHLCPAAAAATGLPEGIAICGGAGDTMQSMLGAGVFAAGRGVDVAGTCSMFCVATKGIVPELSKPGSGLIFNSGTLPDTYFYWGFIRTGGLSLRWYKDSVCRKADDARYYQTLSDDAAERVPAGCGGVLFLPYLTGGSGGATAASGAFLNLSLDDDQTVMWRAVLEAIGYDYMEITDTYRAAGVTLDTITVTEGGSRDSLWNQIKSDMLNAQVVRYRTAGGALVTDCVIAAQAAGDLEDPIPALSASIVKDAEYTPNPDNTKLYRELFDLKTQIVKTNMTDAFAALSQVRTACGHKQ